MPDPLRPPALPEIDVEAVTPGGRSRLPSAPVVALIGLSVAIAVSIGLAQAYPVDERPERSAAIAVVTFGPTTAPGTVSPSPSFDPAPAVAARINRQELVAGVLDGSLEGWLVYADAVARADCPTGTGARCSALPPRVAGLPLQRPAGDAPDGRLEPVPGHALLVLRVVEAGFQYEGSLVADPDGSPTLATLDAQRDASWPPDPSSTLRDAAGWLVQAGPCLEPPSAFEPCPRRSFLADDKPLQNTALRTQAGEWVELAEDAWGINPPFDPVLAGPFLVRPVVPDAPEGPAWEIVARYDPSHSVRVVIP